MRLKNETIEKNLSNFRRVHPPPTPPQNTAIRDAIRRHMAGKQTAGKRDVPYDITSVEYPA
jgi:hypothetical protein